MIVEAEETGSRVPRKYATSGMRLSLLTMRFSDNGEILGPGLRGQVPRVVPVRATVVHVDVEVTAEPSAGSQVTQPAKRHAHGRHCPPTNRDRSLLDPKLGTMGDLDVKGAGRHRDDRAPRGMEIPVLELPLAPVESIVGVTPGIVRCIAASIAARNRDSARKPPGLSRRR